MPRRRASIVLLIVLLATPLAGLIAWRLSQRAAIDDEAVAPPPPSARTTTSRHRSRSDSNASGAGAASASSTKATVPPAAPVARSTDWYDDLQKLVATPGTKEADAATRDAIVAAAGKGRLPGGGLHAILRRATDALANAVSEDERRRAQATIDWVIGEVLRPYREDRAKFAKVYREVRFGDGALDAPGGSLVRQFRFGEAAQRLSDLRSELKTSCYDTRAVRAAVSFAADERYWTWYRGVCRRQGWDVPPEPTSAAAARTASDIGLSYVTPHLKTLESPTALVLARIFIDVGEPNVAAECLARANEGDAEVIANLYLQWLAATPGETDAEVSAMRELRARAGFRVPASADGLTDWFAVRRGTDIAHAVGGDGDVELGAWDAEMTKSFLESGLAWAPEEWEVERLRFRAAESAERDGVRGFVARSPQWEVFSDVSAEFAAQATLVLESAYTQAQAGLGLGVRRDRPIGARIYRRRQDYKDITHDESSGHWIAGMNSVLTFLDDPTHTDFDEFRYPTLVHEATHAALSHFGNAPAWMHEGLACFVARFNPTWSLASNFGATRGFVSRARTLESARDAGLIPSLDDLLAITGKWDADDFGPITAARYAAAESLFVHLADDAEHWKTAATWLGEVARRRDPSLLPVGAARQELADGWRDFIDWSCGRLRGER